MNYRKVVGGLLIVLGIGLIMSSFSGVTGAIVGSGAVGWIGSVLGLVFILGGVGLMELIKKGEPRVRNLISLVKQDTTIRNLAEEIENHKAIQYEIDDLMAKFARGIDHPGMGTKNLFKKIRYLRGDQGGRVFFRNAGNNNYEILGYAIGTGQGAGKAQNERKVIKQLRELYDK
jgi:hypothetical protein